MSSINIIPFPNDENSFIINLKTFSYIIDKNKLELINTKSKHWFIDNNNHLCLKEDNNTKMLLEILTDTNTDDVTYSFLNDNKYDYRLSNVKAISNEIITIQENYINKDKYNIIEIIYSKSSKRYKKDTHIKNVVWRVIRNEDKKELLVMFANTRIIEMSVECLNNLLKCFELFDTIWFYSPLNGYIMSKSNIGGLYLHLILLGNTSIKHQLVIHKNENKLENCLDNLHIVNNEFEINSNLSLPIINQIINISTTEYQNPKKNKQIIPLIDEPYEMIHPNYGKFYYNKWYPLKYIDLSNNLETIEHFEILVKNNNDNYCYIRKLITENKYFNYTIPNSSIWFSILYNGKSINIHILKAMLYSVFNTIRYKETIDHIDNNYKNNNITNLQWLSLSDNCKKGQATTVEKTYQNGGRNGKYILIKKKDELNRKDHTKSIIIGAFRSIECATKYIKEVLNKEISNKSLASKITRALKNPHYSVYSFHFETFINDLDEEIWRDLPKSITGENKTYQVSSFGRVRNSFGDYMFPTQNRYNKKYSHIFIDYKKYPIHLLVWIAFFGHVPENMIILHNDLAPLNANGAYRNYLEDLRVGNYSQNSQEYCLYKHFQQVITNENPFEQFIEKTPELSDLGLIPEPTNYIGKLMSNPPKYIQYIRATDKRGSKFVIGRQCPGLTTDVSSSSSKLVSDEEKFLKIIEKYDQITGSNYLNEITI